MPFKLPPQGSRVSITGRTGSGKTRAGIWLFAVSNDFRARPCYILDTKGEKLFSKIEGAEFIKVGEIREKPGLYIMRPDPRHKEVISEWLWKVWAQENNSLFIDEGYSISQYDKGLEALLTQGRSKKISVFTLTQRPSWCSRFVFSEADFFWLFYLSDPDDFKVAARRCPRNAVFGLGEETRLPDYWGRWYDVNQDYSALTPPVPSDRDILEIFWRKLRYRVRLI